MSDAAPAPDWEALLAAARDVMTKAYAPYIHPALDQKSLAAYIFTTFIWPGKRLRYDGTPLVLPARSPDEEWVPKPEETKDDLGAIAPAI